MADRSHPKVRKAALLVSALTLTPDEALETFRKRRMANESIDLQSLRAARGMLDAIGQALVSTEPARWRRLEQAFTALKKDAVLVLEEPKSAATASVSDTSPDDPPAKSAPAHPPVSATVATTQPSEALPAVAPSVVAPPVVAPPVVAPSVVAPPVVAPPATVGSPAAAHVAEIAAIDVTAALGLHIDLSDTLPFEGDASAPAPVADQLDPLPGHDLDGTAALRLSLDLSEVSPFSTPYPELTVEQYASLAANLKVTPEAAPELLEQYGVASESAAVALNAAWHNSMEQDTSLRQHFEQLEARYIEWLRQQRP